MSYVANLASSNTSYSKNKTLSMSQMKRRAPAVQFYLLSKQFPLKNLHNYKNNELFNYLVQFNLFFCMIFLIFGQYAVQFMVRIWAPF